MTTTTPFDIGDDELATLTARLAREAQQRGELDIAYRELSSPIGTLYLAATERGLVRVGFEKEGLDAVLEQLAEKVSPRILRDGRRLDAVARQLDEYFEGVRHVFDLPLDTVMSHGFRRDVQATLPQIPYGTTMSYRDVAILVGNPGAVRAVGTACATNPHGIVVPCHRVLRSDGSVGQYLGGSAAKAALLQLEALGA